jgi:HD-GYP domain-containing protein (c-di-GMP phosphodiesterase class II)
LTEWDFTEIQSEGGPQNNPFSKDLIKEVEILLGENSNRTFEHTQKFYNIFQRYAETLFTQKAIEDTLSFKDLVKHVEMVCNVLQKDSHFLLRIQKTYEPEPGQSYLVSHGVKCMILSMVVGAYLKLPKDKLIELGVAALIHEIGMLKIPSDLYLSRRMLSPEERKSILTHPILGYNLLKSFDFPLTICLATLQHHERENSKGYPQRLAGDKINLYSKIIAVVCSYEALTTSRPHKNAKNGHVGILDLLKNEEKQYDDTVVRALVFSLSVYPIGLYVLLSNGRKAQVVDANPENPRFPVIRYIDMKTQDENKTIILTSPKIAIVRPLDQSEIITQV